MPEKCVLSHGSGVLDPRDSSLLEPSCGKSVHSHTVSALGGWGGGIPLGGGGSANREPGSYIHKLAPLAHTNVKSFNG